jgi:predicted amino acid-binding ACT domain protein
MKIFISSRIRELQMERKTAVDSVHLAGHEPVFIEAEPEVKDKKAKKTMDLMLQRSNALISISYISLGSPEQILGRRTPIEYEMYLFRKIHPEGPIFLFAKKVDRYINREPRLMDWRSQEEEKGPKIIEFDTAAELSEETVKRVKDLPRTPAPPATERKVIRYEGPDYVGLIEVLSETLWSAFGANIDYISQGARADLATVLFGCSFRHDTQATAESIKRQLMKAVRKDMEKERATQKFLTSRMNSHPVHIRVEDDKSRKPKTQFFVEIRTIDTPGQLNAVCKVLKRLQINIDDVTLRPAPAEYPRQTVVALWISSAPDVGRKEGWEERSVSTLARLETEVRDIIGVRSFSIRMV